MPIVFEQPGPYNRGVFEQYGMLEQMNRNADRMARHGGGGGGGGGIDFYPTGGGNIDLGGGGGGGGGGRPSFQEQLDFNQAELNQGENMRLQRMQQAMSALDNDDTLAPDERDAMKMQLQTGIDPLLRRRSLAQIQHTEMQNKMMQDQIARMKAMEQQNAEFAAGRAQATTVPILDTSIRNDIQSEWVQNGWSHPDDIGDPTYAQQWQQQLDAETRKRGGVLGHNVYGPAGFIEHIPYQAIAQRQAREDQMAQREDQMISHHVEKVSEALRKEMSDYQLAASAATRDRTAAPPRPSWMNPIEGENENSPQIMDRELERRVRRNLQIQGIDLDNRRGRPRTEGGQRTGGTGAQLTQIDEGLRKLASGQAGQPAGSPVNPPAPEGTSQRLLDAARREAIEDIMASGVPVHNRLLGVTRSLFSTATREQAEQYLRQHPEFIQQFIR